MSGATKGVLALVLAALLAVMAYAGLWLAALSYAGKSMKSAVEGVLNADLSYGAPIWIPDAANVSMRLPFPTLSFHGGPVQKIQASSMQLDVGFFNRDHWRLVLPARVDMTMANGAQLTFESQGGEITWLGGEGRLSLRAKESALKNGAQTILAVDDLVLSRAAADNGVRLNLASRPVWNGTPAQLSGQVLLPESAVARVAQTLGGTPLPTWGHVVGTIMQSLQHNGGEMLLDNVSFRHGTLGAGLNGKVQVDAAGRFVGRLMLTADKPETLQTWLRTAGVGSGGLEAPQFSRFKVDYTRFFNTLATGVPSAHMETQRGDLLINGTVVARSPVVLPVVQRLWP